MKPAHDPLDLSLAEAARIAGCAPRTLRQYRDEIGYTRRFGKLWFRREDVERWSRRGYRPPQTETAPTPIRRVVQAASRVGLVTGRPRGVAR